MFVIYCIFAYGMCLCDSLWAIFQLSQKPILNWIMLIFGALKFLTVSMKFAVGDYAVSPFVFITEIAFTCMIAFSTIALMRFKFNKLKEDKEELEGN